MHLEDSRTRKPAESKVYKCQRVAEHVLCDSLRDRIDDRVFKRRIQSRALVHAKRNKWEDRVTRAYRRLPGAPMTRRISRICPSSTRKPARDRSRVLNIEIISRRKVTERGANDDKPREL